MRNRKFAFLLALLLVLTVWGSPLLAVHDDEHEHGGNGGPNGQPGNQALLPMSLTPCVNGMAGTFPCRNVDLASLLPLANIGGGSGSDLWGWTDPLTNREYALMGRSTGTSFVDITNPEAPIYLGNLPAHNNVASVWRSIKVYNNHAFIVSEATGHGMQVFDLTQLRSVASPPVTFAETAHYNGFSRAHTLAINEQTGFAYAAGSSDTCSGGLHMINVQNPLAPTFAGCFAQDGYTHESQCVVYHGPDAAHQGREICFNANEDTLTIVDVTNKNAPVQLSRTGYAGSAYTHQGWLTDDHAQFLLDDELDERNSGGNSRTYIWNLSDLDAPVVSGVYSGPSISIDHNLYVRGRYAYEANYRSGLRILDAANAANASLNEVAFFDIFPIDDAPSFNGAWGNYPFFKSGTVIVSGIEQGLFVLRPNLPHRSFIDDASFFVRQQYRDFLNRTPDIGGLSYWTSQITRCGSDENCIKHQRVAVSAAFFVEQEFQRTGSFIYRFYRSSLGRRPLFQEFSADRSLIAEGPQLEQMKQAFANQWVQRQEFLQIYPASQTAEQFVDALLQIVLQTTGVNLSSQRTTLINEYQTNGGRARVVRLVADDAAVQNAEYNRAFVLMQYFGYLQRNPDEGGYQFWLDVVDNRVPGNYLAMVCAFLTSEEYQLRFGPIVSRANSDCAGVGVGP
ncbi:MAG: choice-of-anchor B family protein [Pyrinomonadaceae bacterium]|nr:choice-of-anchor B family protein [Pyrinomonadaceae bacterium]